MGNGKNGSGIAVGFGIRLSTGAIIVGGSVLVASVFLLHHHHMRKKHHGMMHQMRKNAFFSHEGAGDVDPTMMHGGHGMSTDMDIDDVNDKVFSHIMTNCKNPHQVNGNIASILRHIRSYEVMLRPLLEQKQTGHISDVQYHRKLKSIIDQITDELELPMHRKPHFIKPDLINHDGSTTDMDGGGTGWHGTMMGMPPDRYRFKRHAALSPDAEEPEIQDFSARMNFAAVGTIGADDSIQHIPIARSNNVELADDYGFSHIPYLDLPVQDIFRK